MSEHLVDREQAVTPLELFFDLVFVFGFTQLTTLLSDNPTWSGLGHALLVMTALWWVWSAYAWLTDTLDASEGLVWGTLVAAMAAMFVAALAVPEAFGNHGVIFGVAFAIGGADGLQCAAGSSLPSLARWRCRASAAQGCSGTCSGGISAATLMKCRSTSRSDSTVRPTSFGTGSPSASTATDPTA